MGAEALLGKQTELFSLPTLYYLASYLFYPTPWGWWQQLNLFNMLRKRLQGRVYFPSPSHLHWPVKLWPGECSGCATVRVPELAGNRTAVLCQSTAFFWSPELTGRGRGTQLAVCSPPAVQPTCQAQEWSHPGTFSPASSRTLLSELRQCHGAQNSLAEHYLNSWPMNYEVKSMSVV